MSLRTSNQLSQRSETHKRFHPLNPSRWGSYIALSILSALFVAGPVRAAERLFLRFGPLKLSLSVSSLETFANEGKINPDLAFYLSRATPEQQALFRKALSEPVKVSPVLLSRLFYSGIGEAILTRIGRGVTQEGGINGKLGMRAAIVLAAFEPEGLTLLNFFKKFPTNIQFEGEYLLGAAAFAEKLVRATEVFTAEMKQLSAQEAASAPPVDFAKMPDIRQRGSFGVQPKQRWLLTDSSRDRQFYVDVYKPQQWRTGKTPVVVFSHGLASRPDDFGEAAEHLASYGYVVALAQHPGSDTIRIKAFLAGFHRNIFDVDEFINRPKDISYTIDELERRNQSEFQGQLNLESVGLAGHSFGGSTAFAIAGAAIDFENLENECNRPFGGLNTSLLLQCRALELPRQVYDLRDRRVSAIFVANPVNSSIFGRSELSKIKIPLLIAGGNYDPASPFVFEQGRIFPWLTSPNKYLAMIEGQAHVDFSQLDAGIKYAIDSFDRITLPSPDLIRSYRDSMTVAFFGTYMDKGEDYKPYLQPAYAAYLSQGEEFKLFLISAASSDKLSQAIDDFRRRFNL
jgi:predicted dienelactone hydrolase